MPADLSLDALIDPLELPEADRTALYEALSPVPPEHCMRGVWLKSLFARMQTMEPAVCKAFEAYVAKLGRISTFAWIPLPQVVACVVRGATLFEPDDSIPLLERTRRFIDVDIERILSSTILRSVIQACGEDLAAFLEVNGRSLEMYYNHGELSFERLDNGQLVLHAEDHHAAAERYLSEGYYQGVARYFGASGASFEIYGPMRYSIVVTP